MHRCNNKNVTLLYSLNYFTVVFTKECIFFGSLLSVSMEMSFGAHSSETTFDLFSTSFIEYMLSNLEKLRVKYDYICSHREEDLLKRTKKDVLGLKEKDNIHNLGKHDGKETEVRSFKTASVPFTDEPNIYGRDYDEKKLSEKILECHEQVIVLVGMGGLGKTTLAKKLYKNKDIENHFATQFWVCVLDDFDIKRITRDSLEFITKKKCSFNVFSVIQEELQEELKGKKFFLILDDIWIENQCDWECLGFLSNLGSYGSKILVTTRSRVAAEAIYPTLEYLRYDLKTLDYKDSVEMFQNFAFRGLDEQKKQELKNMSMDIVKRCNGLPLMISVIGKLLNDTDGDKKKWRTIIESDSWKTEFILNTYKISYDHLSNELKQCFLYCSAFPKDHMFDRAELANLWIAQGLVKDGASKLIKEVEIECVDGLLHRSFLEQNKGHFGEVKYSVHDIMHDLAKLLICDERSLANGDLSVSGNSNFSHNSEEICAYNNNCIEPIVGRTFHHSLYPIHADSKQVRVVICDASYFDTISVSVDLFKHLRYLDLIGAITNLPKVVCQLYNLYTLRFQISLGNWNSSDFDLPKDIGNLKKLQHMYVHSTKYCGHVKLTCGIGELVNLQTLPSIIKVTRCGEYCTISVLKNLSYVGGTLAIIGLENVKTVEEAKSARLEIKKNIKGLEFRWNVSGHFNDVDLKQRYSNVLDNLLPNENIENLRILNYYGNQFPNWLSNGSLANLTVLFLSLCSCETLPVVGKIPFLKDLTISGFTNLKQVGIEIYDSEKPEFSFKSLVKLKFYRMNSWEEWRLVDMCHFHSLNELYILYCSKLHVSNASRMLSQLRKLKIIDSPHLIEWCRRHADTFR